MNTRCPQEVVVTCDSSSENQSAATWDPSTGTALTTYKNASALGHHSLQLMHDSYLVGSSATKPFIYLWPLNSQANTRLIAPGKVSALACTPNGAFIAAAVSEKIFIWQSCNGQLLNSFARHYQAITCLLFNGDGSCLASAGEDGLIFVWSLSQLISEKEAKPLSSFAHHSLAVKDLYFGKIGCFGRLYSVSLDKSARIYNVHSGQLLLSLVFDLPLESVCADLMENELFVGSSTGTVIKCSLREPHRAVEHHVPLNGNKQISLYKGHTAKISALSVSIDSVTLLTGSADGMVYLWDIASCQIVLKLAQKGPVVSAFFAPAYDNFSSNDFRPSLIVKPLQRVSEPGKSEILLEVGRRDQDDSWILNFDWQSRSTRRGANGSTEDMSLEEELRETKKEVVRLKKINSEMFGLAVDILDKTS